MPTLDGYYTTREAADELGLSHVTMRDAVRRGVVKATKVARRSLIPAEEVERYKNEVQGTLGWDKRKAPDYRPNEKLRAYQRSYYQRRKAARKHQPAPEPADEEPTERP